MVVKKAEFVMLLFQSTPSTSNVSSSSRNIFDLLLSELGKKFDESQKFMQDMLLSRNDRVDKLDKGKGVNHTYSAKDLNPDPLILHPQLTEYMVCQQIISLGSHHRQAQFGHSRLVPRCRGWSDRSDWCHGAGLSDDTTACANSKFSCSWPNR